MSSLTFGDRTSSSSSSSFDESLSAQDGPQLDPTTEPWFPATESDWDMMMNCNFDLPFNPLFFWDPSLAMDPCLQSSTLHLEPEPCTYETLISSTEGIRDCLNKVLADLGHMQSDYQTKLKQMAMFVVLVRLRYVLLTNKGKSKRPPERSRFCARTSTQQRSGVNS
jgi:hypothetical protein